ncbi:MAG TPA: ATP-binding protein [Rhodospirillaceae bacterium]|nr:ATP-binding protein [Rhodospirillaceae bacterium]
MAEEITLTLRNNTGEIGRLLDFFEALAEDRGIPATVAGRVALALDETAGNVIAYAWSDDRPHDFTVVFRLDPGGLTVEIIDDGIAYDPLTAPPANVEAALEDREIGGLGVHLTRSVMDGLAYRRVDGFNHLLMTKTFSDG